MKQFKFASSLTLIMVVFGVGAGPGRFTTNNAPGTPLSSFHLHNLFRATPNVFSGSSPNNNAAFEEIAKLGVKTIISVDGGKPDVETARKHGLRYIHLPVGYDSVTTNRVAELTKAARSADGPFYVHCHHGLHRGPAAVAIICEAAAGWTTNQAVSWLKQAGTSTDYPGLYRSAIEFRPPPSDALGGIVELPEVARIPSIVEAMVAMDAEFERLKAAQKTAWNRIPAEPDASPAHMATVLWEHLRELARAEDTAGRAEDYRAKLSASEKAAEQIRLLLGNSKVGAAARDTAFKSLGQSCVACHKAYRN
jgi:protein tyrosine phosphatase (PTP) superfamily phosphohydrolase (DUF442 family)/cytochrome c556